MLKVRVQSKFKKDLKLAQKRGNNIERLKQVIETLSCQEALDPVFKDHQLIGSYVGCRECHIQPDFLLIYRLTVDELHLIRLGSHSDLFR